MNPRRILVINVARIGDTLLATPALRALAKHWPDAAITYLGHPKRVEVAADLPFLAATGGITKHSAPFRGWLSRGAWDLALVYGFDPALVRYALRVATGVVGFRQDDPALDARLLRCVEPPKFQSEHGALMRLALTRALGVPDAGLRLAYHVNAREQAAARALLARRVGAARPLVGLQPRAFPTKAWRDWPVEHFAALCRRVLERWRDARFLLFGGAEDRPRTEELEKLMPAGTTTSLAGLLGLRESAAVMNELDLFIGLDSGPTHIMGALEAPMIALYHCLAPGRFMAPLERSRCYVVDHPKTTGCSADTPMGEISVDAVWSRVLEALAPHA